MVGFRENLANFQPKPTACGLDLRHKFRQPRFRRAVVVEVLRYIDFQRLAHRGCTAGNKMFGHNIHRIAKRVVVGTA